MASFTIDVTNKYGVDTFQDVKNTYDWIVTSVNELNVDVQDYHSHFLFYVGEIYCSTDGIEEFVQHAYGMSNFRFINFDIHFELKGNKSVFINTSPRKEVSITSEDKSIINDITDALKKTDIDKSTESALPPITINGDNNAIAIDNSSATAINRSKNVKVKNKISKNSETDSKKSKLREILRAIAANIASNAIWYLLCILIGMIIAFFMKTFR